MKYSGFELSFSPFSGHHMSTQPKILNVHLPVSMQVQANEIVLGSCSGRQNRPRCAAWASKIGANVPRKIWAKGGFEAVIRIWRDRQDFKF